jgi:hypothetical protein
VRNRLKSVKKAAHAVNTGRSIHDLGSRVEGVIAAEYLEKLKADTHRGLRGRAERGLSAGGLPYGYRTEELPSGRTDPHGRSVPAGYHFVIDQPQAAVVRRIFELYASGEGLRSITHRLNAEGTPAPRGKGWAPSALQVMLANPIYRGEYVWNRSVWVKDHETGKRRRFERPEAEWIRHFSPDWQIVSAELWDRARSVAAGRRSAYVRDEGGRLIASRGQHSPARYLLSGFLACAECGGSFRAQRTREMYGCGWRRDRGEHVCRNSHRVPRQALEDRVLGAIRDSSPPEHRLFGRAALKRFAEGIRREDPRAAQKRLEEIEEELANLARSAPKTGNIDAAADQYAELEQERAHLKAKLVTVAPVIDWKALRAVAEVRVIELRGALEAGDEHRRMALRGLLAGRRLQVSRDPERVCSGWTGSWRSPWKRVRPPRA